MKNSILIGLFKEHLSFFIISIIGFTLLAYNVFDAPLTADELSAINRSNVNSISELFSLSIFKDVHPPLIQVFLYYWLKVVGYSEFLIKLPFLLMGFGSVYLVYQLASKWFSKNAALLSVSFFTSLQFVIMYSQISRPYISGVFLVLLFALQWTKLVSGNQKIKAIALYVVFGILAAYNHHFTTLQVAIIGLTGLFFLRKRALLNYLLANFIIAICYLPSIYLTIEQMSYDGIDYLAKPEGTYFYEYLQYVFHYSLITVIIPVIGFIYLVVKVKKIVRNKYTLITFLWFVLPFVIGFVYSVLERPVMPFRSLIFSLPFMILFLFSFYKKIENKLAIILSGLIIIANVYTLIAHRNHYQIFKKGIVKSAVISTDRFIQNSGETNIIYNTHPFNIQFYQESNDIEFEYASIYNDIPSPKDFRKQLRGLNQNHIIAFNLPNHLINIIEENYPNIQERDYGFNYNYYCLSKTLEPVLESSVFADSSLVFESLDVFTFKEGEEWGPILNYAIGEKLINGFEIAETKVEVLNVDGVSLDGLLVFELKLGEEVLAWRASETKDWVEDNNEWQSMYYSVQLNELIKQHQLSKDMILSVYYWNRGKQKVSIKELSIKIKKGNNLIYSLLEDFN